MLGHSNGEKNDILKGVELIFQKLMDTLQEQGLQPIDAVGQKFDPKLHDAILTETSKNGEDDIVSEEWKKGYLFKNRLLRPSQVKVLKKEEGDM